ncbi:MAG: hypothetical protein Q8O43_03125 [Dehalococcoidia bacterium]|nr:hypothetical protein [Dehalococcoidia bacterium]
MKSLQRKLPQIVVLVIVCSLAIWHVFSWYSSGKYDEMFAWLSTGKAYLVVLYNLGLMLVFGFLFGQLMSVMAEILAEMSKENSKRRRS